ncbi:UDP-galactopyranose mutase [Enterococcus cecorum]|uniref:UDP-galactopyranose mutase n=1 Tax=Enterococcus cecorum TaxID=44008 RepID=UPI0032C3F1BB
MNYLIVGAGLFGATTAHKLAKAGHHVTIIEKRDHLAGNIYTKEVVGIQVHQYGAHIFHTSNEEVWQFVNQFAEFNHFINSPFAFSRGKLYSLPFNMSTFYQLWKLTKPKEVQAKIDEQRQVLHGKKPENLEEQAIDLVGTDIYETLIKEYTEKQWGRKCSELPPFIIKRLPVRLTFNNNYFNDKYQGIPIGGYTKMVEKMLDLPNIIVHLKTDFFAKKEVYLNNYDKIIFTGMIDQFFDYRYGPLAYRSLRFEHELLDEANYQGNAVINYIDAKYPFTRIIEHKHFEFGQQEKTVITKEYPANWQKSDEPYYPVQTPENAALYQKYCQLAKNYPNVIFGGRLGMYQYFDMHKIIEAALNVAKQELAQ